MKVIPYKEVTDSSFADLAAKTFTVRHQEPGILVLSGRCPRCDAAIEFQIVSHLVKGFRFPWKSPKPNASQAASDVHPFICTCRENHPGRPSGIDGCGAYWLLGLAWENNGI